MALAWRKVKFSTIVKCFKHVGILNDGLNVQARSGEDLFENNLLIKLLTWTLLFPLQWVLSDTRSVEEYANGDDDLAVCVDTDDVPAQLLLYAIAGSV